MGLGSLVLSGAVLCGAVLSCPEWGWELVVWQTRQQMSDEHSYTIEVHAGSGLYGCHVRMRCQMSIRCMRDESWMSLQELGLLMARNNVDIDAIFTSFGTVLGYSRLRLGSGPGVLASLSMFDQG